MYLNARNTSRPDQNGDQFANYISKAFSFNTSRPRQTCRHFADNIFKCILLNENAWDSPTISLKFVPKVRINNIPALVSIMAWRRPGDKPLSKPMMVSLLTHICVTRLQWVKKTSGLQLNFHWYFLIRNQLAINHLVLVQVMSWC